MTPEETLLLFAGFVILVLLIVIYCMTLDSKANWKLIEDLVKENMRLAYQESFRAAKKKDTPNG